MRVKGNSIQHHKTSPVHNMIAITLNKYNIQRLANYLAEKHQTN
jgi:hypothetical protein